MRCDESGLTLAKAELVALLEFSGRDPEHPQLFAVQFVAKGDRCFAYATDGHRAVEADGESDGATSGEWVADRKFLVSAKKLLAGKNLLRLEFSGASLHEAAVIEQDIEVSRLTWPADAANVQVTFPGVHQLIKLPTRRETVRCMTLPAAQLAALAAVGKAAQNEGLDIYPPAQRHEATLFRSEGTTQWTGMIMPFAEKEKKAKKGSKKKGIPKAA